MLQIYIKYFFNITIVIIYVCIYCFFRLSTFSATYYNMSIYKFNFLKRGKHVICKYFGYIYIYNIYIKTTN